MKHFLRLFLLVAASTLWVGVASADTIVNSGTATVTYTSGPIAYSGTTNPNTGGAFNGSAATYTIGTGVGSWLNTWANPINNTQWISFDPYTQPGDIHGLNTTATDNSNVPTGTYVYTTSVTLAAGTYSVDFSVMADDTTAVWLGTTQYITAGSGEASHCVANGPTCTQAYNLDDAIFVSDGSPTTITFDVQQIYGNATGLDFSIDFAPTPEPSSLVLLGTGLLGAAGALRRRLRA